MDRVLTVNVGVVVACEAVDHPWQDHAWRPVSVFVNAPDLSAWRELRRGPGFVHYHAATIEMELHRKETPGYRENLSFDRPSIYVVLRLRDDDDEGQGGEEQGEAASAAALIDPLKVAPTETDATANKNWPVEVHMVTASPFDVEAYGDGGDEIIEAVPMPDELIDLVSAFIEQHHVEQPFKKRKQKRHHREEDHHFGNEPVVELRARMARGGRPNPEAVTRATDPDRDPDPDKDRVKAPNANRETDNE